MSKVKYSSFSLNSLRQTESDKKELNELNSRFVNFINLVKLEQKKCETLTNTINDLKKKIFSNHTETRLKYNCELNITKEELNRLCLELNACMIRERNSRYLIQLYCQLEPSITHENLEFFVESEHCDKLSCAFSASQSSLLSSCSSQSIPVSSSSYSSSSSSTCSTTDSVSADSALPPSPSLFSLETYLNTLNQNRFHLNQEYELKFDQCQKLKQQCIDLNEKLFNLNNNLDTVRLDNSTLNQNIIRLKKEINFYKNFNNNLINDNSQYCTNISSLFNSNSQQWYTNELEVLKREIRQEFENSLKQDLELFETDLQEKILKEIDKIQQEYDKEYERVEAESTALLNELSELNENLLGDFDQYQQLRAQNTRLNNRMIELSNKLLDFNQMDESLQNKMILNYSVKCLAKDVESRRENVKELRKELNQLKVDLSHKNIFGFSQSQFSLRPYTAHIENTKSNLFSNLIVKFDFIQNSISGKNRSILNSLKLNDSTDGHCLTMENDHKILDIDLSEWTIRREIYSCIDDNQPNKTIDYKFPKYFKLKRRKKVNFVCSSGLDLDIDDDTCSSLSLNSLPKLTQLKCACCACKLMIKRNGDTDIMEVKDVHNWGTGSLTVTKLIDTKNVIKMANFKFLKQIWIDEKNNFENSSTDLD